MDRPPRDRPRRQSSSSAQEPDRGLLGLVRAVLTFLVFCGLVVGAILAGPTLVDELDAYANPVEVEQPPPAGDRSPDVTHPDDPQASSYDGQVPFPSDDVEDFVHLKVNEQRADHDLEDLEWDGTIASVSRAHSVDMYDRDYFSHDNPDGESPLDRFQNVSNYCRGYGENIAMSYADQRVRQPSDGETVRYRSPEELAEGLVQQWMNSPPHRDAILSDSWDRGGVGIYISDAGEVYATHNFCTEL